MTLPLAILLAGFLAIGGGTIGWLTAGGVLAAALVGTTIFAGAGLQGALLLGVFFVTASVLTYSGIPRRHGARRHGRTWRQVIANGGVAAAGAALVPSHPAVGWAVLTGALAAAQADTWATEIGTRSPHPPRLITGGRVVAAGTSGAVTPRGTIASLAGAATLGGVTSLLGVGAWTAVGAALGGAIGSLADSILGATLQGHYHCDGCNQETEQRVHACGSPSRLIGGAQWLDNDGVNLSATAIGALVALLVQGVFG